jgi:chromosomal replication initiator protein
MGSFSKMTFENYIIGESNRMAYSMALAVAERPGEEHLNPLFIYGKSGVGKTHLLVAIKNYLDRSTDAGGHPLLKTVYVDSTEFVNDYADASADHSREKTSFRSFKERYEDADVLLIDDVQSFQGKKETLKIVFELFNKLTSQGKQVVMSADIAPKNIDIDERYQSRFNSGATFDIQAPEMETKLSIINSTIDERLQTGGEDLEIPPEVRTYIAEISSSNIRELKSAVTIIFLRMMTTHQTTISVEEAAKILENHFSNDIKRLSIADIQKEVEAFYKVSHAELVGKGRRHAIAYPRQVAMYLCRQLMEETFESIGKAFGGKDHSTVKYSVDLIGQKVREDKGTRDEIDIVIAQIHNR